MSEPGGLSSGFAAARAPLATELYPSPDRAVPFTVVLVVPAQIPGWLAVFAEAAMTANWLRLEVVSHAEAAPLP